jgi:hypothetical protein
MSKINIPLDNGYKLVAEQNIDSDFNKEIIIGIRAKDNSYVQDLVIVRPTYTFQKNVVKFDSDRFEMLIFGDEKREDYTNKFEVSLFEDEFEE